MKLESAWVDKIFEKLTLRYGVSFTQQWRGIDVDAVRNDWATVLGGYSAHPGKIKFALDNLPLTTIKNVDEFKALCRQAPREEEKRADDVKANPERAREELSKLNIGKSGKKAWAYRILKNPKNYPDISKQFAEMAGNNLTSG